MIAIGLLLLVPFVMWCGQSLLLRLHGLPIRYRLDSGDAPRAVRTWGRVITQGSILALIIAYPPLVQGQSPVAFYGAMLPIDGSFYLFAHGAAAATTCLCVLFAIWIATDRMRVDVHQSRRRWMRRLLLLPATAVFGALAEELLFRGVLFSDLLKTFSPSVTVVIGTLIFASAHYVRAVKRWWTIGGHLALGVLLGVAFLVTDRSLWLPVGLHAGGIMMIMGARPFVRYRGPAWLTGASIFPYAGVFGIVGLGVLTAFVARYYGAS